MNEHGPCRGTVTSPGEPTKCLKVFVFTPWHARCSGAPPMKIPSNCFALVLVLLNTTAMAQEQEHVTPAKFEVHPRGYLQADGRFFLGDAGELAPHQVLLRRARISLDGTIG